jgi:hypothetical protein
LFTLVFASNVEPVRESAKLPIGVAKGDVGLIRVEDTYGTGKFIRW